MTYFQSVLSQHLRWRIGNMVFMCICIAPLTLVSAESVPKPDDFAYGLPITVQSTAPIQEVDVPQRVYEIVTHADLSDLRVFNHNGEVLPHSLRTPVAATTQGDTLSLPFFPLPNETSATPDAITLHFRADQNGTVLDLGNRAAASSQPPHSSIYLIDASGTVRGIEKLILRWSETTSYSLNTRASLESSSDLTHWNPINGVFPILRLRHGDATIERHTLVLPRATNRYYLLKFSPPTPPVELTAIHAQLTSHNTPVRTEWKTLFATHDSSESAEFIYNTDGMMPIDRVHVKLALANTVASVEIQSAAHRHGPWVHRARGLIYRIASENHETVQEEFMFTPAPTHHRLFKLIVKEGLESLGKDAPTLVVGWTPQRLTFMVRGNPPYLLAYGNVKLANSPPGSTNLLKTLPTGSSNQATQGASLGVEQILGGETRRQPTPPQSNTWKKVLLWLSLLAGVAILMVMAVRLVRSMQTASPPTKDPSA